MRRKYQLIYKTEFRLVPDYVITEEQYLDYYQNSNDPTFENFEYPLKFESFTLNTVSYVDTAFNVLKQGKKLWILTWQDFANFIEEWVFSHGLRSCHKIFYRNGGISFTTTKTVNHIGENKMYMVNKKIFF